MQMLAPSQLGPPEAVVFQLWPQAVPPPTIQCDVHSGTRALAMR